MLPDQIKRAHAYEFDIRALLTLVHEARGDDNRMYIGNYCFETKTLLQPAFGFSLFVAIWPPPKKGQTAPTGETWMKKHAIVIFDKIYRTKQAPWHYLESVSYDVYMRDLETIYS